MFGLFALLSLPLQLIGVNGLDLQRAHQNEYIPCSVPNHIVPVNVTWLMFVKKWYYPYMSVLDLYLEGLELSGKSPENLQEDELYYDACITYEMVRPDSFDSYEFPGGAIARGFDGQHRNIIFEPINGMEIFHWRVNRPGSPHEGISYTTLTDNSTFLLSTSCQQGRMTWGAITTAPTLPAETVAKIYAHALSNGFSKEEFTGLRYDSCGQGQSVGSTGRNPSGLPSNGGVQSKGVKRSNIVRHLQQLQTALQQPQKGLLELQNALQQKSRKFLQKTTQKPVQQLPLTNLNHQLNQWDTGPDGQEFDNDPFFLDY